MDDPLDRPEEPVPAVEAPASPQASEGSSLDASISYHSAAGLIDGTVEIAVSPDAMSATATFYPPRGDGLPIDPAFVHELLRRMGVVSGVLSDDVAESAMSCNLDRRVLHDVVVARGAEPVSEIPEHASLEAKIRGRGPRVADSVQRVDFRELATLIIVRAGETIATMQPKRPGSPGVDVRGKETPYSRESPVSCVAGRNVERRDDKLVATVDGRLIVENGRADVDEVLMVKGEVDFHTGNISFPGDVVIDGAVHDGFKVWSGASIVCKSTMDAFDVNAKKDLTCAQGIIGRRRGQVRVGGEIRAKYIQNCRVAARGDMHIASAIVNSRIFCLGTVDLGDKGVIMGGEYSPPTAYGAAVWAIRLSSPPASTSGPISRCSKNSTRPTRRCGFFRAGSVRSIMRLRPILDPKPTRPGRSSPR